jgi:hypothetical protein
MTHEAREAVENHSRMHVGNDQARSVDPLRTKDTSETTDRQRGPMSIPVRQTTVGQTKPSPRVPGHHVADGPDACSRRRG